MRAPVAVAGGGIAGCAACLALAAQAVPTVWIAPRADPSDKPSEKPGESLAAAAGPLLREIGLGHLLADPAHRRVEASFTCWGSAALLERSGIAHPGGLGHVVDRGRLEAGMAAAAAGRPEITLVDASLTAFRREGGGWRLETDAGQAIDAGFMIDATGRAAMVGRRQASHHRADRLIAAFDFLDQIDPDVDPTPATLVEGVENGWWYATLLADRRLVLNYYSDPDLMPRGIGRDAAAWRELAAGTGYIARWIETAGFALSRPPRLASAGTAWLSRAAGPDWIAVGDAAAAFDPLSAHGMTTALWTGIHGARAAHGALQGDPAGLACYADKVSLGIARFRSDRARIYAGETRFPDRPFWRRRQGGGEVKDGPAHPAGSMAGPSPGSGGTVPRPTIAQEA